MIKNTFQTHFAILWAIGAIFKLLRIKYFTNQRDSIFFVKTMLYLCPMTICPNLFRAFEASQLFLN